MGATVAGSLLVANPSAAASSGPRARLKVGFLGTAYSHFAEKHRRILASPDFELVGLSEESATVRAAGPKEARWMSEADLLAAAEVVIVESAPADHARHARAALMAGRHVHLEKPPAASGRDFRELVRLAQKHRCLLQIGYMWRYNPGIIAALEAAQRGWLGEVFLARATMNTSIPPAQRLEWARFRGGAMFEQGSHLVDMLVRLLGKPTKVSPFLKTSAALGDGLADNTLAVFEYPRAWGIITSAPLQPNAGPQRFLEILGTRGSARVQPLEPPGLVLDLAEAAGPYRAGRQEVSLPRYERYTDEFVALAAAVRGERPLPVSLETEIDIQDTLLRAANMR